MTFIGAQRPLKILEVAQPQAMVPTAPTMLWTEKATLLSAAVIMPLACR